MRVFRFYCRYWAAIGGLIFVVLAFVVGIFGNSIPDLQRLMILLFMALLFHQFEEYIFPGGFPAAANIGLFGEKEDISKYPLNELSATIVNTFCAYTMYIVGIFCFHWLWLDIFLAYFTIAQVFMHCIKLNHSLRSWYSPGCLSALFVMVPVGAYTLWNIATNYALPHYFWWIPVCVFPVIAFLTIMLPIMLCRGRDTKFGFASFQADEFEVRHGIASLFCKDK